jgi:hypothetical protein
MRRWRANVLLSVALHALTALGLGRVDWYASPPLAESRPIRGRLVRPEPPAAPTPREQPPAAREPVAPSVEQSAPERPGAEPAPRAVPSPEQTESAGVEPSPVPGEDLATRLDEALRSAFVDLDTARRRQDSVRSLRFPGTVGEERAFRESEGLRRAERGLQEPLTAFDSPSKGRAGITERFGNGQVIRWVTDDCYQLLGVSNPFLLFPDFWAPSTLCGQPRPRDDLFATSKSYLMDDAERAEADAVFQRRERLRREPTGAVMPLAEP